MPRKKKPSKELMIELYQQLGGLFFLVANADKKIQKAEINALKEVIERVWLDYDNTLDDLGRDTAFQIEESFIHLIEHPKSKVEIISGFKAFMERNPDLFSKVKIKLLIVRTAEKIADSFRGSNIKEKKILEEIDELFF